MEHHKPISFFGWIITIVAKANLRIQNLYVIMNSFSISSATKKIYQYYAISVNSKNVAACAKHYVGDGGTTNGINENNTVLNSHGLLSIHMAGYYTSIIKGVSTVMISYSSWNGKKMHENRDLITGFLKKTLRFRVKHTSLSLIVNRFVLTIEKIINSHMDFYRVLSSQIGKGLTGSLHRLI